jgi:hypothetical protein
VQTNSFSPSHEQNKFIIIQKFAQIQTLHVPQRARQIRDNVRHILDPCRQTHQAFTNSNSRALRFRQAAMRRSCRVKYERINIAEGCRRQTQFKRFHKSKDARAIRVFDFKRQHAAKTTLAEQSIGKRVLRMRDQAGIIDLRDGGMRRQPLGNLLRVRTLLAHA